MGFDRKFGVVTTERGAVPRDEPVFVIRGKDAAAPLALMAYADAADRVGADPALGAGVRDHAKRIAEWQRENRELVAVPDTVPGQLREDGALSYADDELKGVARDGEAGT